ncbi:MAG: hypothetical protein J5787_08920 [Alphaproteobacteria bacterium]|nr:hypothetical protein [Alphaproteobacteria bacterium]MBO4643623.1 hypothetical protein [Alphaproteobacteria bacterium]
MSEMNQDFSRSIPISESDNLKQNLEPPFKIVGDKNTQLRITEMINQIVESETGRKTLEIASKAGYTLGMEFSPGCNGGCNKEKKHIVLNPLTEDLVLIGVLVHESRHAGQFERGEYDASDDRRPRNETIKTNVMRTRAVEADAQATAIQVLGELMEKGNHEPLLAFCRQPDNHAIGKAFEHALWEENALENGAARTAAFLAWYENEPVKKAYDEAYQVEMMERREARGDHKTDTYATSQSAAQIVKELCLNNDGSCYFSADPKILESGHYTEIHWETAKKIGDLISRAPAAKKTVENFNQPQKDTVSFNMARAALDRSGR